MATPIARLGDMSDHGGVIITASPNWKCNGIPIARVTDQHSCPLPGHGVTPIESGSPNWSVNGLAMARVGSVCGCGAVISSGSPNWNVS